MLLISSCELLLINQSKRVNWRCLWTFATFSWGGAQRLDRGCLGLRGSNDPGNVTRRLPQYFWAGEVRGRDHHWPQRTTSSQSALSLELSRPAPDTHKPFGPGRQWRFLISCHWTSTVKAAAHQTSIAVDTVHDAIGKMRWFALVKDHAALTSHWPRWPPRPLSVSWIEYGQVEAGTNCIIFQICRGIWRKYGQVEEGGKGIILSNLQKDLKRVWTGRGRYQLHNP